MESGTDKFEKLTEVRQRAVMNAATEVFGRYDYPRASTELIARKAGISKSLLFFYFGNKRNLYMYVINYVARVTIAGVVDDKLGEIDDFFEVLAYTARRKVEVIAKYPFLMDFAMKAFYPQKSDEVKGELDSYIGGAISSISQTYFRSVRWDKFRDDMDPKKILSMLVWMTDGYIHEHQRGGHEVGIDDIMTEFHSWCALLRRTCYKEEYL